MGNRKFKKKSENRIRRWRSIKNLLEKKEQSNAILRGVQSCIEQANICLRKSENDPLRCCCNSRGNSPTRCRSKSPTYTYDRRD